MKFIDYITRNDFLKKLYPNDLPNKLVIGRIELLDTDKIYLCVKTTQKPFIDIAKWGCWGKDYNAVSIELIGQFIKDVNISNWTGSKSLFDFSFSAENNIININFINNDVEVNFLLGGVVFQSCSVFLTEN
ncbi:hypothetical protein [Bombiscardovia apis]|nr:hypothetical protein [Bombiscardovia apis]